jgi:hypothetical protein
MCGLSLDATNCDKHTKKRNPACLPVRDTLYGFRLSSFLFKHRCESFLDHSFAPPGAMHMQISAPATIYLFTEEMINLNLYTGLGVHVRLHHIAHIYLVGAHLI